MNMWNVYIAVKFNYFDGWFNKANAIIRQIKQKQWLRNENKISYFWSKRTFPPLHHMIKGNYLKQHKEAVGGNLFCIDYKRKNLI